MTTRKERIRQIPIKNFGSDVLAIFMKYHNDCDDAGILVNELIQICCGLAFEFKGNVLGREDLIRMIDVCFEYSKNHDENGMPYVTR